MRLKTNHGTYVVAGQDGELLHLPDPLGEDFLSVWTAAPPPVPTAGSMEATVTQGPLAPSTLVVLAEDLVAFRRDQLYLCADPRTSELRFDRNHIGEWECFTVEAEDGKVVRNASFERTAPPPNLSRPVLIETLAGYQIMSATTDTDMVTITWPESFQSPINRYALSDGSWIVDVDRNPDLEQPFLVYWFYPFNPRIHVWRLDRSGRRASGYDLFGEQARLFLLARQALGPAFTARLYMSASSQKSGDWKALLLLGVDLCAAAEAGSAEALYAVLRRPLAFPPATVRNLAARAFHVLRATNLARSDESDRHLKRLTVDALAEALIRLDPALGGLDRRQLQVELDLSYILGNPERLPPPTCALPFTLHPQTEEALTLTLGGDASNLTLGILIWPQKRSIEFHYISSEDGVHPRVLSGIQYANYALSANQATLWEGLTERNAAAQVGIVRFEVGDTPTAGWPSAAFERRVGDTIYALVPDAYYFDSKGFRRGWFHGDVPHWSEKTTRFIWRGSTTGAGLLTRETLAQAPRVRLCELGLAIGSVADFGITAVVQAASEAEAEDIKLLLQDRGLWRGTLHQHEMGGAKFLMEIDGNANSWGFLAKLLMGCCVLKVDSPYEQWFYDRLQPWVHYVPVVQDLSDLSEKVQWCLQNEETCCEIAKAGHRLAESLSFDSGMSAAAEAFVTIAQLPA